MNLQYFFRHGLTLIAIIERPRKSWGRDCKKCIYSDLLSVQCIGGGSGVGAGGLQSPHFCRTINNFLLFYQGQLIRT